MLQARGSEEMLAAPGSCPGRALSLAGVLLPEEDLCHVGIQGIQRVLGISWNTLCARERDMTWNSGSQPVCLSDFGGLTSS